MGAAVEILRIVAVIALLCAAAAVATPKGRLPLALRGVYRVLRRDCGERAVGPREQPQPAAAWKRLLAFLLVLAAAALCLL